MNLRVWFVAWMLIAVCFEAAAQEYGSEAKQAEPKAAEGKAEVPKAAEPMQEKPAVPAAPAATTEGAGEGEAAGEAAEGGAPATRIRRLVPRPEASAEQFAAWAAELRNVYALPADQWPPPVVDSTVKWVEIGLLPKAEHPVDNPFSREKAALGARLFFEPRLSGSGQLACASCHDPDLAWADGRTASFGNRRTALARNAPSVMNTAFYTKLFWDGRAGSLEEQAAMVLLNPDEMHADEETVVKRLSASSGYRDLFRTAFGEETITFGRVTQALAVFERSVVGGSSRFDAFLKGSRDALSDEAVVGLHLYRTSAGCMNCHHGPAFTDNQFHDLGLSYYGRKYQDLGRYRTSNKPEDVGRFRTPTLRNVARTAPYMHVGFFQLDGVLNLYNAGMPTLRRHPAQKDDPLFPTKSPLLHPLYLNRQDLASLKAFLESLSEPQRRIRPPMLPADDS